MDAQCIAHFSPWANPLLGIFIGPFSFLLVEVIKVDLQLFENGKMQEPSSLHSDNAGERQAKQMLPM